MSAKAEMARVWRSARSTAAKRLFLDRQAEFWLGELDPVRSLGEIRARVVEVIAETADTKTFMLRPNAAWRAHRAGQYTSIEVEIDGVRARRCYSISSAPGDALVSITVKRMPGGRVSTWLHEHVRTGHIVRLGAPAGDFVLPATTPDKLLLLSGGSGITPVMSMLRDLAARDALHDVVFVHHARSRPDVIFRNELTELAARHRGLRLHLCLDDDVSAPRGFDETRFAELVPDFAERSTFLCGPGPLMDRVGRLWERVGASDLLERERFTPALRLVSPVASPNGVQVRLARSERNVVAEGEGSLLEQLERAGERPVHGCRIGICHTCKCRKQSGTVQNLVTGEVSGEPDQEIQLCISVPRSDLELDL
ncbi:MAG TPA: ferredoxin reductase [Polyangiales bacterium]|nr:ferredoxin reductase [Polyangiales bacterium]